MTQGCQHAATIADVPAPRDVCEACIEIGGEWVNLRQCLACGLTLCCNSSPNQHASGHFTALGHPLIRSAMPGETWTWCYLDESMVRETPDGWETYDPSVEAGMLIAKHHLEAGGTTDVAEDYVTSTGFPLGEWLAYVRDRRERGALATRDAELLEAIPGWRW